MSDLPLDPAPLLGTLAECGVDFVVIGALAVAVHAEVRGTADVDVMVPAGNEENRQALGRALEKLRAERIPLERGEAADAGEYPTLMFRTRFGKLDVLYKPDGSDAYPAVKRRSLKTTIGGHQVAVAGKDDLVRMKLAAGRPNDIADVANMTTDAHGPTRRVRAKVRIAQAVDEDWARELAEARVRLFDPRGRVTLAAAALEIDAVRAGLTDLQLGLWARALADRLAGAGVVENGDPEVEITDA